MELTKSNVKFLDYHDVLELSNLYGGYLCKDNKNIFTIFLNKNIDGKQLMKAIIYDKQLYPIGNSSNEIDEECAKSLTPLSELLSDQLEFLKKDRYDIYDSYELTQIASIIYNYSNLSEEDKKQIENVIDVAVNWWANAACNPVFDNGAQSEAGNITTLLAYMVQYEKAKTNDEAIINRFKINLANAIRRELLIHPDYCNCTISVDYAPDPILSNAAEKAGLNTMFPWKTTMWIYKEQVKVWEGYFGKENILYSVQENKSKK